MPPIIHEGKLSLQENERFESVWLDTYLKRGIRLSMVSSLPLLQGCLSFSSSSAKQSMSRLIERGFVSLTLSEASRDPAKILVTITPGAIDSTKGDRSEVNKLPLA